MPWATHSSDPYLHATEWHNRASMFQRCVCFIYRYLLGFFVGRIKPKCINLVPNYGRPSLKGVLFSMQVEPFSCFFTWIVVWILLGCLIPPPSCFGADGPFWNTLNGGSLIFLADMPCLIESGPFHQLVAVNWVAVCCVTACLNVLQTVINNQKLPRLIASTSVNMFPNCLFF